MRGGEKMLESLLELFPDADIWTHVYRPAALSARLRRQRVFTSYINKLPFASKLYPFYLPLMPGALLSFDLQSYDLIISSEAGPAKGVVAAPDAHHICYCHSPMRYIWDRYHEYARASNAVMRFFMRRFAVPLRLWDVASANLVDRFITNSHYTARRIRRYYNRAADVVFGPADTEAYYGRARAPLDYYLCLGQVTYNKRVDIAIEACISLERKIIVAGAVSDKKLISRYRKSRFVRFAGRVSEEEIKELFSTARALLFPGVEDMGLVPVEAAAAGCPVIAYREGGACDTVKEGVTGLFFDRQDAAACAQAIERFEQNEAAFQDRAAFSEQTRLFSKAAFLERIKKIVEERRRI
jgi:glycosyltransferase involved in cell wall biosynthesis